MPDLETNDDYDGYTAEFIEGKPVTYRIAWVGNHADDEVIDGKQIETYYLSRSQLFTSIEEAQKYVDSSGICSSRKPIILRQVDNGAFELKVPRPVTAQVGMKNMSTYVIKQPFVDSIEEIKGVHHWCAYVSVNKRSPLYGMDGIGGFDNLNVGYPDVNGGLNFGGKLKGQDQDLWFFGWDYNHSWNWDNEKNCPIAPLETDVMADIRACITWINGASGKFQRNEVSHDHCPKCNK